MFRSAGNHRALGTALLVAISLCPFAARGQSPVFTAKCIAQNTAARSMYPKTVNWETACSCAGEKLRAQGYNPETFNSEIEAGMSRVVRQPHSADSQAISQAFVKRETDAAMALSTCIAVQSTSGTLPAPVRGK